MSLVRGCLKQDKMSQTNWTKYVAPKWEIGINIDDTMKLHNDGKVYSKSVCCFATRCKMDLFNII